MRATWEGLDPRIQSRTNPIAMGASKTDRNSVSIETSTVACPGDGREDERERMTLQSNRMCANLVGGRLVHASGAAIELRNPRDGRAIGSVCMSTARDVDLVMKAARGAWTSWHTTPLKERTQLLFRFRDLLATHSDELAQLVATESGKTQTEARAGLLRGIEVVEFASSLQNMDAGGSLEVSRGVSCEYRREPLGVVAGITPFNFPAMVPLWMFPIALTVGNAFVLKPSEKVPLTACRLGELLLLAGYPPGVFSIVHGDRQTAELLVDHPELAAVAFVGSTNAAKAVFARASRQGKRALCLGGAKNILIVAPDADEALTVRAVLDSFTGCAGQRCMAGSLLLTVGAASHIIAKIADAAGRLKLGTDLGAIVDRTARERLVQAITEAQADGAALIVDGRSARPPAGYEGGNWLAPTVIDHARPDMECARTELFGPVLTAIRVETMDEALGIERQNRYGNATSVFTQSGSVARYVCERASSGMVGVNVGVPVPRDPFSFGGTKDSKFGHGDITGPAAVEFWSNLKKITSKWAAQKDATWMS
jgi:malonate-semialdehyde dehydrogenase (acetylating)/methylmalonate-semialdehyde dehydrogenase